MNIFGANWKTTVSGVGTAFFAAITFFAQISYDQGPISLIVPAKYKPTVTLIAGACTLFLWVWNGIAQKSKEVTGGTQQQDANGASTQIRTAAVSETNLVTPRI